MLKLKNVAPKSVRSTPDLIAIPLFIGLILLFLAIIIKYGDFPDNQTEKSNVQNQEFQNEETDQDGDDSGGGADEPAAPEQPLTYTSDALGVRFSYLESESVVVKEEGDTIYIYPAEWDPADYKNGQKVAVLEKSKTENAITFLQEEVLGGVPRTQCIPKLVEYDSDFFTNYPAEYELYTFVNTSLKITDSTIACPTAYPTYANGVAFFLYDPGHPDRILYLSVGQYMIVADAVQNLGWQDTIEVLDR